MKTFLRDAPGELSSRRAALKGALAAGLSAALARAQRVQPKQQAALEPVEKMALGSIWAVARNPANSYDSVGLQHNQILAGFFGSQAGQELRADLTGHKKRPASAYLAPFFRDRREAGSYDPTAILDFAVNAKLGSDDWPEGFVQRDPSEALRRYLGLLLSEAKSLPRQGERSPGTYGGIRKLELTISGDDRLSSGDKKSALMAASGVRYSDAYWHGPNNHWPPSTIDWGRVCAVDGMGCIGGPECGGACSIVDFLFQW